MATAIRASRSRRPSPESGAGVDRERVDLAARRAVFERYLRERLRALRGVPPRLAAAIRYAVLGGGKRVRPLFVLLGAEAVGGARKHALPAAVAFEYVHAFSLVHDDLPAMDDDDWRRGRPTLHKRFEESTAILAGDALLAMAFEEMARLSRLGLASERTLEATRLLARAAGAAQMVAGQQLDMEAEGKPTARRRVTVERIHRRKTGALIAAAVEVGVLVGGGSAGDRRRLRRIGEDLGFAFQIVDDLLDERSSRATIGKSVRADRARGKATFPAAVGIEEAERTVNRLVAKARTGLRPLGRNGTGLRELADFLEQRER